MQDLKKEEQLIKGRKNLGESSFSRFGIMLEDEEEIKDEVTKTKEELAGMLCNIFINFSKLLHRCSSR